MAKETKFKDVEFKNNDQLVVKIDDVGNLTLTVGMSYDSTSRNPPISRSVLLKKEDALLLMAFIDHEENNLPLARGVPA